MWAQTLVRPGVFELVEVDDLDPSSLEPGQTLLRVAAGAICGSDLPYFAGKKSILFDDLRSLAANIAGYPLHEVVGEVLATDDPDLPVGSRAVGWATEFTALAEYTVTQSDSLMVVPEDLETASALTLQPLACVTETLRQLGDLRGLRVAVLGLGPFGLLFAHAAATAGARVVVGVDRVDRTDVAKSFRIDQLVHSASDRWAQDLEDADRPDLVIEAIGHQTSTVTDALEAVAHGGRVFCFGVPDDPYYPVPMQMLFRKGATLSGGIVSDRRACLARALEYLRRFPELQEHFVTHTFPFRQAQRAFELASVPSPGRLKVQISG